MHCNTLENVVKKDFRIIPSAQLHPLLPAHSTRASAYYPTVGAPTCAPAVHSYLWRSQPSAPAVTELPLAHRQVRQQ